jgi:hypothetical protein
MTVWKKARLLLASEAESVPDQGNNEKNVKNIVQGQVSEQSVSMCLEY